MIYERYFQVSEREERSKPVMKPRTERFRTSMIQEIKGRRGERAKLENVSVHLCFWKTKVRDYSIPKENALTIQKTINFLIIYMWACLICHPPMIPRFKLLYYERKEHWKNQKIKEWKDKKTRRQVVRQWTFLGAEVDDLRVSYSNTASFFFLTEGREKKRKEKRKR